MAPGTEFEILLLNIIIIINYSHKASDHDHDYRQKEDLGPFIFLIFRFGSPRYNTSLTVYLLIC